MRTIIAILLVLVPLAAAASASQGSPPATSTAESEHHVNSSGNPPSVESTSETHEEQEIALPNWFAGKHETLDKEGRLPPWLSGKTGEKNFTMLINSVLAIITLFILGLLIRSKGTLQPGKAQNFGEWVVESLKGMIVQFSSEQTAQKYFPLLASFFIYILILNLWGLMPGFHTPTSIYNTTLAFAVTSVIACISIAIREIGFIGFIKHLAGEPLWLAPVMLVLGIIEQFARMLSLSLRLFGNMFGEDTAIAVFAVLGSRIFFPVQFPVMILHFMFSIVQAMIFTVLTASYIEGFIHEHHEHEGHGGHTPSPVPVHSHE